MFRRLWQGCRSPQLTSRLRYNTAGDVRLKGVGPSRLLPPTRSWIRYGDGARKDHRRPAMLLAGIYGPIFLSIALLVTDETLDWPTRSQIGMQVVQSVVGQPDHESKTHNFWSLGPALLKEYVGSTGEIEYHNHYGTSDQDGAGDVVGNNHYRALRPTEESGMEDQLDVRLMTAPDPDHPGGTVVLCQVAVATAEEEPEDYVALHGGWAEDVAYSLFPAFERFAGSLPGPARGVMLVLYPQGNWYCLYWDGKRWLNLLFLEWQTAASMGL
ncbi:hypothetical protein BX600DRAFT_464580, partial [Xylariales sp. PMI_506]